MFDDPNDTDFREKVQRQDDSGSASPPFDHNGPPSRVDDDAAEHGLGDEACVIAIIHGSQLAIAPGLKKQADEVVRLGVWETALATICDAVKKHTQHGELLTLVEIIENTDLVTGLANFDRRRFAASTGVKRETVKTQIHRLDRRGYSHHDGRIHTLGTSPEVRALAERFKASAARAPHQPLMPASTVTAETVDAGIHPSTPASTVLPTNVDAGIHVHLLDRGCRRPSMEEENDDDTRASEINRKSVASGSAQPYVESDGGFTFCHPSGHRQEIRREAIDAIVQAFPERSRDEIIVALKALMGQYADRDLKFVPKARWLTTLKTDVAELLIRPKLIAPDPPEPDRRVAGARKSANSKLSNGAHGGRAATMDDDEWRHEIEMWRDTGVWAGPDAEPGQAGCSVPKHILAEMKGGAQ